MKSYVVDAGMEEQEARFIYERNKQRLQTNDWVRIAHISKIFASKCDSGRRTGGASCNGFYLFSVAEWG